MIIRTIGGIIAVLMGIGAVFGAVITMYTAVASRTREIATLRALGFGSIPVVVSVLVEASLLALARRRDRRRGRLAGLQRLPDVDDELPVVQPGGVRVRRHAELLGMALGYALLMGLVGGLLPAIRAARLPVVTALREL